MVGVMVVGVGTLAICGVLYLMVKAAPVQVHTIFVPILKPMCMIIQRLLSRSIEERRGKANIPFISVVVGTGRGRGHAWRSGAVRRHERRTVTTKGHDMYETLTSCCHCV